jgi:glycerophosphoryl diester phosphodiesterase
MMRTTACSLVALGLWTAASGAAQAPVRKALVAHRGASAYAPEHTSAAYELALGQGADFVEQDLAVTKDGVLVCIHDVTLERTTNVEEVFPDRFVERKNAAGESVKQWPVNDFTLEEIRRLDAGSWFAARFAGARVPTFQEAIDLVRGKAGLYPELKDPEFYRARNVDQTAIFVDLVRKNGLVADPKTPLIVQSFDPPTLMALAQTLPAVPRVFLFGGPAAMRLDSADKVKEIAAWATGLGPNKAVLTALPNLVAWAHAAGMTVTPWTYRSSDTGAFPSVREEMAHALYTLGVDALFTDNPDQFPRR